jgi:putative acetyltransferase
MTITPIASPEDRITAEALLRAYGEHLQAEGIDICLTGLEGDIANLSNPDAPLLLAKNDENEALGCVSVKRRAIGAEVVAEMKRLYVLPHHRASGAGRALAEAAIAWAREHHLSAVVLDTEPKKMPAAGRLYRSLGFRPTERFNTNAVPDVEFYRLDLTTSP